jgi:ubiquinone/menaquinone biosynthesis C-methylase UbiE
MNDVSGPMAPAVVKDISSVPFTHLLDVGGGSGTWTLAWLAVNPSAKATLYDLPHVVPMAEARLRAAGQLDRVRLVPGDFEKDPQLPTGADLAWISAIIHQQNRAENRDLFAKTFRALRPAGRVLIRDIVMDDSRTRPAVGALFAINMLTATRTGGTFTLAEIRQDLEASGFREIRQIRQDPWMNSVVMATKPA